MLHWVYMKKHTSAKDLMNYRSGLYWGNRPRPRPHFLTPLVLVLEDGRLSMTSPDAELFNVALSEVSGLKFYRIGGLEFMVNGNKYKLGLGNGLGGTFTQQQIELLKGGRQANNNLISGASLGAVGASVGSVPSPVAGVGSVAGAVGEVMGLWEVHKMDQVMNTWQYVFANNGLVFKKRIHHNIRNILILTPIVFFVVLMIVGSFLGTY